jgi:hypothetical protein
MQTAAQKHQQPEDNLPNRHASISLVRQMSLHLHYKKTTSAHKLATIFGNSRVGALIRSCQTHGASLSTLEGLQIEELSILLPHQEGHSQPPLAQAWRRGRGGRSTWINVTWASRTLLGLLCSHDRLQDILQGGQED